MTLNEKAFSKIYAKIKALENEIKSDTQNIEDGLAIKFVPLELHKSVLDYKKKEKRLYEYKLKLIKKEKNGKYELLQI